MARRPRAERPATPNFPERGAAGAFDARSFGQRREGPGGATWRERRSPTCLRDWWRARGRARCAPAPCTRPGRELRQVSAHSLRRRRHLGTLTARRQPALKSRSCGVHGAAGSAREAPCRRHPPKAAARSAHAEGVRRRLARPLNPSLSLRRRRHDEPRPITVFHDEPRSRAVFHDEPRPIAAFHDEPRPIAAFHDEPAGRGFGGGRPEERLALRGGPAPGSAGVGLSLALPTGGSKKRSGQTHQYLYRRVAAIFARPSPPQTRATFLTSWSPCKWA